ncbi:hypothetical protein WG947_04580 [Pontibacter sp. H259]|uniref:hypothetical protein n=1 Tax=Pontibacter sp. H259 TaxID=3133421 RepID=UPI0030C5AAC5
MKGLNGKLIALCAGALFLFGCEKNEEAFDNKIGELTSNDCDVVTFETASTGVYIDEIYTEDGFGPIAIHNRARNSGGTLEPMNRAVLFDSDEGEWTGDDDDLVANWGNVLIIQQIGTDPEDDPTVEGDGPNDNQWGGEMLLTFPEPVTVKSLRVVDIDEYEDASYVYLYSSSDQLLDTEYLEPEGNNSKQIVTFNGEAGIENVSYIRVVLAGTEGYVGSGAIDEIEFCVPGEDEPTGCTRTQGYWKNHADPSRKQYDATWDDYLNVTFFSSGKTYLQVLQTPPKKGDAYYILAHQYIAAVLNKESGASAPPEVNLAIAGATDYFAGDTNPSRAQLLAWAELLDDYNNGLIGPGHCDD